MTRAATTTPARAARRKLLRDRWTELLTTWGDPYAGDHAGQLIDVMDDLGFTLPTALDDPPPPSPSTDEGRARARQILADALAARTGEHPATPPTTRPPATEPRPTPRPQVKL